jgi:hypothetical protein
MFDTLSSINQVVLLSLLSALHCIELYNKCIKELPSIIKVVSDLPQTTPGVCTCPNQSIGVIRNFSIRCGSSEKGSSNCLQSVNSIRVVMRLVVRVDGVQKSNGMDDGFNASDTI